LYIENIKTYINGSCTPVEIIGVEDTLKQLYNFSDTNSFLGLTSSSKTHTPWVDNSPFTLEDYIDAQIQALPSNLSVSISPPTLNNVAFDLVLNPDKNYGTPETEAVAAGSAPYGARAATRIA